MAVLLYEGFLSSFRYQSWRKVCLLRFDMAYYYCGADDAANLGYPKYLPTPLCEWERVCVIFRACCAPCAAASIMARACVGLTGGFGLRPMPLWPPRSSKGSWVPLSVEEQSLAVDQSGFAVLSTASLPLFAACANQSNDAKIRSSVWRRVCSWSGFSFLSILFRVCPVFCFFFSRVSGDRGWPDEVLRIARGGEQRYHASRQVHEQAQGMVLFGCRTWCVEWEKRGYFPARRNHARDRRVWQNAGDVITPYCTVCTLRCTFSVLYLWACLVRFVPSSVPFPCGSLVSYHGFVEMLFIYFHLGVVLVKYVW